MRKRTSLRGVAALAILAATALVLAATAAAATVVVTQNSADWAPMDTRPGGAHRFTEDYGAPAGLGSGSLELTTNATTAAKADYWTLAHAGTPLASVTDLAYWTYQAAKPSSATAPVSRRSCTSPTGTASWCRRPGSPGTSTPASSGRAVPPPVVSSQVRAARRSTVSRW